MKQTKKAGSPIPAPFEPKMDAVYTLEVIGKLSGVPSRMILEYQEHGLIVPRVAARGQKTRAFDDEALRALRRIEHLRTRYEMNLRALKLAVGLFDELERLRSDLRSRTQGRRPV
jgi:DNA-binding transcriptional MerR regulator